MEPEGGSHSARHVAPPAGFLGERTAIVFTDIVGSTSLAESLGDDAWAEALTSHHAIVRRHFDRYGGFEAGNQGDGFLFLFLDVQSALDAAVETMQSLDTRVGLNESEPQLSIRAGIHWGHVGFSAGVGFFGIELHRASRISGAAQSAQILTSGVAAEILAQQLRHGLALVDHGGFWMKNLRQPERLIEVVRNAAAPLHPAAIPVVDRQLPSFASELFGRDVLLEQVLETVDSSPGMVVTLCGFGGVGKTRLAVELVLKSVDRPSLFVDLSSAETAEQVIPAIARAVGLDPTDRPSTHDVSRRLNERCSLLVVDNLEQIIECAADISTLAQLATEASILVTSRVPLRVSNEIVIDLEPLPTRQDSDVSMVPSTQLVLRLGDISNPTRLESEAAATICSLVDGLPLAIELASGWVDRLGIAEVARQLGGSIGLLTNGRRDAPDRHQSLTATTLWSYDLLSVGAQDVFRAMSQFVGGATFGALEALGLHEQWAVPAAISELVDHRLATMVDGAAGPRFVMMRVIREFAASKLVETGELAVTRNRVAKILRDQARNAVRQLGGLAEQETYVSILDELANFRNLFEWATNDAAMLDVCLASAADLLTFWWHDHLAEGVESLRKLTELPGADASRNFPRALVSMSILSTYGGQPGESMRLSTRAVTAARASGRAGPTLATALQQRALGLAAQGEGALALEVVEEGLTVARSLPDFPRAMQLVGFGPVLLSEGQESRAESAFIEAISIFEARGPSWLAAAPISRLSECALQRGDFDSAALFALEGVERWAESPGLNGVARAWAGLARVRWCQGEVEEARAIARDAAATAMELRAFGDVPWALIVAGAVAVSDNEIELANELFAAARSMAKAYSQPILGALRNELSNAHAAAAGRGGVRVADMVMTHADVADLVALL